MKKTVLALSIICLLSPFSGAQVPTNGLIIHYPFNNTIEDFSNNNRDAQSPLNPVNFEPGSNNDANGAVIINGSSDISYDFFNEQNTFTSLGNFTVACWVRKSQSGNTYDNVFELGNGDLFLRFINQGPNSFPEYGYYSQTMNYYGSDGGTAGQTHSYWNDWHHIALTSEVIGTVRYFKLYIDGSSYFNNSINGSAQDAAIFFTPNTVNGSKMFLGYRPGNTNLDMYGAMQDFYLYNRALSTSEVVEVYNGLCSSPATSSLTSSACDQFVVNNIVYNTSGTYTQNFYTASGCDSVLTINLTIDALPVALVQQNGNSLTAQSGFDAYQWIDCSTGTAIASANQVVYNPTTNGTYAVAVSNGSCSDTSLCFTYSTADISETALQDFSLYPNPASSVVFVKGIQPDQAIKLLDAAGRLMKEWKGVNTEQALDIQGLESGVYWMVANGVHQRLIIE